MTRLILYIAVAYIVWRIVMVYVRKTKSPRQNIGGQRSEERIDPSRGPDIDYSKVRDAEWRDKTK